MNLVMRQELTAQREGNPRIRQLLDLIRPVVSAKGFAGTSMQDLAQAAGMSAGNFYRYFPSKSAIMAALIEAELAETVDEFERIEQAEDLATAVRRSIARRLHGGDLCDGPIWAEIDAAACRQPEIAALVSVIERQVVEFVVRVLARLSGVEPETARAVLEPHARVLMLMIQGAAILIARTRAGTPQLEADAFTRFVLDQIERHIALALTDARAMAEPRTGPRAEPGSEPDPAPNPVSGKGDV